MSTCPFCSAELRAHPVFTERRFCNACGFGCRVHGGQIRDVRRGVSTQRPCGCHAKWVDSITRTCLGCGAGRRFETLAAEQGK